MIGVLFYQGGNARNVLTALERLGISAQRVESPGQLSNLDGLIFPGVGSASAAMRELERAGLIAPLRAWKRPLLGLCLGMQLFFESSAEGNTAGLGLLEGDVKLLPDGVTRPHMGWNRLSNGGYAYFTHSYFCLPADPRDITMTTDCGIQLCAGVRRGHLIGTQWHPEKSGETGDLLLEGFADLCS